MDPQYLYRDQWALIATLLPHLALFVALMVNMAISFLMAHAVIPSLTLTQDIPADIGKLRRILYPISGLSLILAAIALGRAIYLIVEVTQYFYPRFAI
jgi:hypothetical protein